MLLVRAAGQLLGLCVRESGCAMKQRGRAESAVRVTTGGHIVARGICTCGVPNHETEAKKLL